jgi:hypothetical protein
MGDVWHCSKLQASSSWESGHVPVRVATLALALALEHRLIISVPVPDTVTFLSLFGVFVVPAPASIL